MSYAYDSPEYFEDEWESKEVRKMQDRLDDCAEFLKAVVGDLYSKEPLDRGLLEWRLDELCDKLGVDINVGTLQIERRNYTIGSLAHFMAACPI